MTHAEALDLVVARTGHARYRELCDASHPSHLAYRSLVLELAGRGEVVSLSCQLSVKFH